MRDSRLLALVGVVATLAGLSACNLPVRTSSVWIDSVTGSVKGQVSWQFFNDAPVVEQSELERWIIEHEGSYHPRWQFVSEEYQNVPGQHLGWGCATAPAIYQLHGELNTQYVEITPDSEIKEFVRIMRTGTESEKRQAVEEAYELALSGIYPRIGDGGSSSDESILDCSSWPCLTPEPIRVPRRLFYLCTTTPEAIHRGPHFEPAVKVYANPVAYQALTSGRSVPMPVGATVLKEKWRLDENHPIAYAAMIKHDEDYDPQNGNWEYVFAYLDQSERPAERGKVKHCIGCHRFAAAKDYLFLRYWANSSVERNSTDKDGGFYDAVSRTREEQ